MTPQASFHQIHAVCVSRLQMLQYEETSSCNISLKRNFCNFTLWIPPALDARGRRPVRLAPPHAAG